MERRSSGLYRGKDLSRRVVPLYPQRCPADCAADSGREGQGRMVLQLPEGIIDPRRADHWARSDQSCVKTDCSSGSGPGRRRPSHGRAKIPCASSSPCSGTCRGSSTPGRAVSPSPRTTGYRI
ncbi:hypothetical protein TRIP_B40448 [uncultured Desulfatiglans sp.]|uniref:Uncharacterized protein n=1 Tax=Uncultured Desulfatiglans sp. TaxID=1748965 RepID=A0A653AG45_UNCDX|nr:hypothetical protein TRIP_B40448 [uncultured Desulfatiglans sp.]